MMRIPAELVWVDTWEAFKLAVRDRQPSLYYETEHTFYGDVIGVTAGRSSPWPTINVGAQRHSI